MRRPFDPSEPFESDSDPVAVREELDAIDEVLAGHAVDPRFAELAELSLLVLVDRPRLEPERAEALDARVLAHARPSHEPHPRSAWRHRLADVRTQGVAFAAATLATLVALVLVASGGLGGSTGSSSSSASAGPAVSHGAARRSSPSPNQAVNAFGANGARKTAANRALGALSPPKRASAGSPALSTPTVPSPLPNGRRTVSSAQLALAAPAANIDAVAQEVFDVVDAEKGIVKNSSVSTGSNAGATFSLSIPSGNLTQTLSDLSDLRGARVASRTDGTQDVNNTYLADGRNLADARALRAALLHQLATATTTGEIDSLQARIRGAEATISSEESALRSLNTRIAFSPLSVQIEPGTGFVSETPPGARSGGFTLGRAGHDALRVLVVTLGVLLIALAVLLPVGLLALLGVRIGLGVRRRRREAVLDAA